MKTPNAFGCANSGEDQAHWLEFSFSFKQWLFYAEPGYEADLKHVEDHLNTPVIYTANAEGVKSMERSKRLYAIPSGLLQHRPLKLLKQVPESNGLEVWRQWTIYASHQIEGVRVAQCTHEPHEQIQGLDRIADEYRRSSGSDVNEDILLTTLVKALPKQLQQHIHLHVSGTVQHSPSDVNRVAFSDSTVIIEDLTEYSEPGAFSSGLVRMLQQHSHALQFDMSCADDDDHWT